MQKCGLVIVMVVAIGCTESQPRSDIDSGNGIDSGTVIDAGVTDAMGQTPDADGFCEFVPTPLAPFPEPTVVAPGTSCVSDDDCMAVEGFVVP